VNGLRNTQLRPKFFTKRMGLARLIVQKVREICEKYAGYLNAHTLYCHIPPHASHLLQYHIPSIKLIEIKIPIYHSIKLHLSKTSGCQKSIEARTIVSQCSNVGLSSREFCWQVEIATTYKES
jgi:hypothetical protein